jgi:hypothetical protein
MFNSFQCVISLLAVGILCGYLALVSTLITVACCQFDKLKAAILDNRQQLITPHHDQEDERVHTIAKCNLQVKLNACIRHHQCIME